MAIEYLNMKEAAQYLGVSRTKLWQIIKEYDLPIYSELDKRKRLTRKDDLERIRQPKQRAVNVNNQTFNLDTVDNIMKLNQEKQFREQMVAIVGSTAEDILAEIFLNDLPYSEKLEQLYELASLGIYYRVNIVRCGQEKLVYPENPLCDQFLSWYMGIPDTGSPRERYIRLLAIAYISDRVLRAVEDGTLEIPAIWNDLSEIMVAKGGNLLQTITDFILTIATNTEITEFNQSNALKRIAKSIVETEYNSSGYTGI